MLAHVRAFINQADQDMVEDWKWRGVPVWSHDGLICTGETYKNVVKQTFAKGAVLEDPSGLFNADKRNLYSFILRTIYFVSTTQAL
jgi:hypothetical protein